MTRGQRVGITVAALFGLFIQVLVVWRLTIPTGWGELESVVRSVDVESADTPMRVDRLGLPLCALPIPFGGPCPGRRLLFDSGTSLPELYREQWRVALAQAGWARHAPGSYSTVEWWTKEHVSLLLLIKAQGFYGPVFDWEDADLVVEAQGVGLYRGRYPATEPPVEPSPAIGPDGCAGPSAERPECGSWAPIPRWWPQPG